MKRLSALPWLIVLAFLIGLVLAQNGPANSAPQQRGWVGMVRSGEAPACVFEDKGRMCVWDARHRGNGIGRSFARDRAGRIHYITHRTAHRAVPKEPTRVAPGVPCPGVDSAGYVLTEVSADGSFRCKMPKRVGS